MAVSESYLNYIKDCFEKVPNWNIRKMFGGVGIFRDGTMFAMLSDQDKIYLRVDDQTIPKFTEKGMQQFAHKKNAKANMPYYECPPDVLENPEQLSEWTNVAFEVSQNAKKKKKK